MSSPQALEPTLLHALRRYWVLAVVTFVVIAAGATGVLTLTATSSQTAEMSMLLEDPRESALFNGGQAQPRGTTTDYLADQQDILDTAEIARRSVVAARERDPDFPYDTVEFLARRTVVRPSGQALVTVRFVADTTEVAVLGANSFAVAYQDFLESESAAEYTAYIAALDGEIEQLQDRIADAQRRIDAADSEGESTVLNQQVSALIRRASATAERRDQLEVDADLLSGGGVRLVTPAVVSQGSATGGMRSLLAVGFIAALGAVGVTYLYALRRRTFTSATEAGLALEASVLGIVPEYDADELDLDDDRDHRFVVDIVAQWQDRHGADEPVVIAVTAAGRGAGVTTSVAAMASVLGWRRKDTAVVDSDVNEQQLTRMLQPDSTLDHAGLTDVIDGEHSVVDVTRPAGADVPAVKVVSRGSRQLAPADAGRLPSVIGEIAANHQVTLIDVPGGVTDTLHRTILSTVDHLLVVVPHGSRVIAVERLRDTLAARGLGCDGVVFNRVPPRRRPRRPSRREVAPRDVPAAAGDRERSETPGADIFESTEP